jgi:ribosomal protein S18 acetylase RimI-like enzyme
MSIVGLVGEPGQGYIIAEGRFVRLKDRPYADVAFIVDEEYQGLGIATYMYRMLIRVAQEKGLRGFTADVLASNKSMIKVFEKGGFPVKAHLQSGAYTMTIPFEARQPDRSAGDTA